MTFRARRQPQYVKNAAGLYVPEEVISATAMASGTTGDALTIKDDNTVHPRTLVGAGGIEITVHASDITIDGSGVSGGGGGTARQWIDLSKSTAMSTSAWPIKGDLLEPAVNLTLRGIAIRTDEAGTQTLECRVYQLSGSTQVGAALATTASQAGPGSEQRLRFLFGSSVTLVAGTRYVAVCVNTGSSTLRLGNGGNVYGKDRYRTGYAMGFATIATASPATGATWTVTTASEGYEMSLLVDV